MDGAIANSSEHISGKTMSICSHSFERSEMLDVPDIHCIFINDAEREVRENWLRNICESSDQLSLVPFKEYVHLPVRGNNAVLIVSGNDTRRMAAFIRLHYRLYKSVSKICLMNRSSAQKRAALIKAGFDDVIDISRIAEEEALCRMAAIGRRYVMMRVSTQIRDDAQRNLNVYCEFDALTPMQTRVLNVLALNINKVISYQTLTNAASIYHEPITLANLKVLISKIRKHLRPGVTITSFTNRGYKLSD